MPHIHRIRVNNVKYNFGTQFYDDFILRFDGKNALYDLANGGGKSVLMLLLFQNLIPNCTLDDKQPIEKLFRTNDGSTSIHSLIEWQLDEADIVDGYKYMLTGFCARKAKDEGDEEKAREAAAIDYFNYVIFYREYNDNDLVNLPLSKGRERMTYTGLRTYLKELEYKNYSLKIHIFDRKGLYQQFISQYGLYESQWEIIRGINKTEGHVRTYFETNYKTTKKVVEDLLIEEIIQKAYVGKTGGGDEDMAKTLMAIRDRLLELAKKRNEISSYDRQVQALESFTGRVASLTRLFDDEAMFKHDLVKTYNGLTESLKLKRREGEVSEKEYAHSLRQQKEIERCLDTVKVQKSRAQLKDVSENATQLDERLKSLEADYASAVLELTRAESMRDYLEYEENEKNARIMRRVLNSGSEAPKHQLTKLQTMACRAKVYIDCQMNEFQTANEKINSGIEKCQSQLSNLNEKKQQARTRIAVAENNIELCEAEEKQISSEVSGLRRQVNALLIEGSEKELREYQIKERQKQEAVNALQKQYEQVCDDMQQILIEIEQIKGQISTGEFRLAEMETFFNDYQQNRVKTDGLLKIYAAGGYEDLRQIIYERCLRAATELSSLEQKLAGLKEVRLQLEEKNPVPVSTTLAQVIDYLRRCYGAMCISGADYLKTVDDDNKSELLQKMPFLPYCVIVRTEYEKIVADYGFTSVDFGNHQIAVVPYAAVAAGDLAADGRIIFTGRDKKLFVDTATISQEIQRLDQQITQVENQRKRLVDQEHTYQEDLDNVYRFIDLYYEPYIIQIEKKSALENELTQSRHTFDELTQKLAKDRLEAGKLAGDVEQQQSELTDISTQRHAVESIAVLNKKLSAVGSRLDSYQKQKASAVLMISQLDKEITDTERKHHQLRLQADVCERETSTLNALWQDLFSMYADEEAINANAVTESLESGQSLADIEVAFRALKEAYEAQSVDMAYKKKLLETYEKNMERLTFAIMSRNMSLEQMAALKDSENTIVCDAQAIQDIRSQMAHLNEEIKLQKALTEDSRANKHRLSGRVENAVSVIEEKYGYFKEVDLKNMSFDSFMKEYQTSLEAIQTALNTLSRNIEVNQREVRACEDVRKDIERLMRSVSVTIGYTRDSERSDANFRQRLGDLSEWYERLRREEAQKKSEFEKDKEKLAQTLQLLKAYDLADEIRSKAVIPIDAEEARQLAEGISGTVKIIMLEKERVEKGIEDMQKIKENFERQCLQRCTDIKMELERLPKMSKITLGDEHIQMINLRIPYVKEEFYEQRMSEYIDRIVDKSESMAEDERLKYLRGQLAWKHLFSVIVTDMNHIRLSLYKRERIREQSRFLKYEEAVGSTGQSQGIYIQFLIAVINYISALHSRSNDTASLKKVLFIDNPFGAAKDIYIWEPIFALLKENHVQLIVPARGATPAITGKFDVNYVLGQKLIGTKQQTVVIDYYSNVDIEAVEYRTIDFEQQVFDFV